ncbi:helix-turn-helix transcriptional regulator [Sporosarcina limicola]|uniref:Translation elongation factor EF-1beta n=1 Tax=Sporosarcina limicola TaxID=34101 RepID=A0A927MP50_9BACL|nr:DNA-binding response regulator [Sporosarcina limicola]MBE1554786.1 translation elongation factor EF-1beta [Sporosarcina limicola]
MTEKQIEQLLKDYHWMINSVKIMRENLNDIGVGLTAQYGIEAVMPKAQGETSDPVYREVVRRSKHHEKIIGYESKVKMIQERIHVIEDVREAEVLHWILEGKGYSWIARHMGLSHTHIKRLSASIAKQMVEYVHYVQNVQKCI